MRESLSCVLSRWEANSRSRRDQRCVWPTRERRADRQPTSVLRTVASRIELFGQPRLPLLSARGHCRLPLLRSSKARILGTLYQDKRARSRPIVCGRVAPRRTASDSRQLARLRRQVRDGASRLTGAHSAARMRRASLVPLSSCSCTRPRYLSPWQP